MNVQGLKSKLALGCATVSSSLLLATSCFAADADVATAMTTALGTVKTDMMGILVVVAPVGIAIAGVILCWKRGIGFFKSISK